MQMHLMNFKHFNCKTFLLSVRRKIYAHLDNPTGGIDDGGSGTTSRQNAKSNLWMCQRLN